MRLLRLLPRASDYAHSRPLRDLSAGLMVGLVALPLALGFGISSGMGAQAGLITAIVAGAVAAVFGGSDVQVSGPTGAMTVVLIPIVAEYGADGVLTVALIAGVILIGLGIVGAGRMIRFIPLPVIEGFTVGIALIIGLQQLPAALGVTVHAEKVLTLDLRALQAWIDAPAWPPVLVCGAVVLGVMAAARLWPVLPGSLVVVSLATVGNQLFDWGAAPIGDIPSGLPRPALPNVPWHGLDALVLPAVAVAALAALESLLSATVADGMSVSRRHNPDRELVGQGLANLVVPFMGGVPATAAIARTAVNVRSGATSRLASLTHALVLVLVILLAAPWVSRIPVAALAGVLIATAIQMVKVSSLRPLLRASRGDAVVFVLTMVATVVVDLVTAVLVGLLAAGFLALRQSARSARLEPESLTDADNRDHSDEERALLDEHIVAYRLEGPLFFAAAHDFLLDLFEITHFRVVILRMSQVTAIDVTGAKVLADAITQLESRGVTVLISGVRPEHQAMLATIGVHDELAHENHLFATTPDAIDHARHHVERLLSD